MSEEKDKQVDETVGRERPMKKKAVRTKVISPTFKAILAAMPDAPNRFVANLEIRMHQDDSVDELRNKVRIVANEFAVQTMMQRKPIKDVIGTASDTFWTVYKRALKSRTEANDGQTSVDVVMLSIIEGLGGDWHGLSIALKNQISDGE